MYDLNRFSLADMTRCGAALRRSGQGSRSLEETAIRIVRHLYDSLRTPQGGRACVLARFFKTQSFGSLPESLRVVARRLLPESPGNEPVSPAMKCLTLMASAGDIPAWNSRHASMGHQAIPLVGLSAIQQMPMIAQLVHQFGLDAHHLVAPRPELFVDLEQKTYNVFHVEEADGSPFVPAQDDFVRPFGVCSVLGFGGVVPGADLFAVILFTRIPVRPATADLFKPLALNVKLAVLPFLGATASGPVFSPSDDFVQAG